MARTRKIAAEPTRRSERLLVSEVNKAIIAAEEQTAIKSSITKQKRFRRPQQRKKCFLLKKLPGEIRNQIYRHAIVQPDKIRVTSQGPGEPPLLRVCRIIRNESRSLYYTENRFNLKVQDWDGALFTPFAEQIIRYRHIHTPNNFEITTPDHSAPTNIAFTITGQPNWANLVKWLKQNHTGVALMPNMQPLESPTDFVVGGAMQLAKQSHFRSRPWADLEQALEALRTSLKGTCSPWGRELDDDDDNMHHWW